MESMNENLSFQENDEISKQAVNTFVENVILEAKISLAHIIITVQSTSSVTAQEEDATGETGDGITTSENDRQEPFVADRKHVDASVYDTVPSKAEEDQSDTPPPRSNSVRSQDHEPPAEKETKRRFSWFRRRRRSQIQPTNESEIKPPKKAFEEVELDPHFITKIRHRGINDTEIFVVNTARLPKTKIKKSVQKICSRASRYIEKNLTTPKFFLVMHGGHCGDGAELKCLKLGKKFYQILKNNFAEKLEHCVVYNPDFSLNAAINIYRPFMREEMKNKISIAMFAREFVFFDIPETILRALDV